MTILMVRHRVSDFRRWKPVFDEHQKLRAQHGAKGHRLRCASDDPNDVVVSVDFPSVQAAQDFLADPTLSEAMTRSGVASEPEARLWEEVEQVRY